jgi:hypothetical protein
MDRETTGQEIEIDVAGDYTTYANKFWGHNEGMKVLANADVALIDTFSLGLAGGYVIGLPGMSLADFVADDFTPSGTETKTNTSFFPLFLTFKGNVPLGKLVLSFGAGPSFAFAARTESYKLDNPGPGEERWEWETTHTVGFGYHGVFGISYALTKSFLLMAEVRGEQLTFRPKKTTLTAYTIDGTDELMSRCP